MIVSILQLKAKPFLASLQSGGENPNREGRPLGNQGITRAHEGHPAQQRGMPAAGVHEHAESAGARRREVKPQPKASAKPAAKKAKPAVKAKPAAKPAKAAAKPVKAAAKKAPVKAVAKAPAKKAAPAKAPAKKQTAAKAAPVKAPAKAAAKPVAKKAAPAVKTAAKPAAHAPAKAAPAKTAPAKGPKAVATPAAAPAPVKKAPGAPAASAARANPTTARAAPATAVPIAAPMSGPGYAKASYTSTMSPVLNPPPLVAVKKDPKLANNWKTKAVEELSDEEILAMPDSEYMNDKQMAYFRLKLQTLKQEILNSAGETTEHLREDTVIVPDPADRATIEEEHALELRTRDRERKLLKKIEQSIGRIDAGDYGYCDETGEPIGVARLLARPTATLSLEAQQRRELKQKMFGD
jgi:DnaK suppressor protein